jgi:predicted DCC family thiol-disulfide oxidoreductase YuxK
MNEKSYIILFDGVCNFCNFWINFIIKYDKEKKFKFAALQSEAGLKLLEKYNLPKDNFETFILLKGNKFFIKSSAVLIIAKNLKGIWKLFYALIIILKPFRDYLYEIIAKNRYKWFGKREFCRIPTQKRGRDFYSGFFR